MPQNKAPDFGCYGNLDGGPDCYLAQSFSVGLFMHFLCKRSGVSCQQFGPNMVRQAVDGAQKLGPILAFGENLRLFDGLGLGLGLEPREAPSAPRPKQPCNSFVPGTHVLMADGSTKPIEKIKVGDKVLATDPKTGKTQPEPVRASFGGSDYVTLIKIRIEGKGKHERSAGTITATEHHRFWNQTKHVWTRADQLTAGTRLRTPGGSSVRVTGVVSSPPAPRRTPPQHRRPSHLLRRNRKCIGSYLQLSSVGR